MLGAILGDIAGSRFEFDRGGKTKDFTLFTKECNYTDDTIMTLAVADALLNTAEDADKRTISNMLISRMQSWGLRYPDAGYGFSFYSWIFSRHPEPYGSYGNGSAMRVSPVGWLYDSLGRTLEVAGWTAEISHNHPEGIKGAQCTAAVIYLSRTGKNKAEIRSVIERMFHYDLSESIEQLRDRHEHVETCMDSMPKALVSFFDGNSYEDVIRNAISLGGDTDTLAAIAGGMAEAYYGIPEHVRNIGCSYLNSDMKDVLKRFEQSVHAENSSAGNNE